MKICHLSAPIMRILLASCSLAIGALSGAAFAEPTKQFYIHTAAQGDTLIGIAQRYLIKQGNWQPLQKLNQIADPRRIRPGTPIRIPLDEMNTASPIQRYQARRGWNGQRRAAS
ncbi:MAG: LysM domain-containing protein [Usitatibacteraceae bacterium]